MSGSSCALISSAAAATSLPPSPGPASGSAPPVAPAASPCALEAPADAAVRPPRLGLSFSFSLSSPRLHSAVRKFLIMCEGSNTIASGMERPGSGCHVRRNANSLEKSRPIGLYTCSFRKCTTADATCNASHGMCGASPNPKPTAGHVACGVPVGPAGP